MDALDAHLIQIVDAALNEAARKSGAWVVCRPGCTQCCMGPFPINQLDTRRLRKGLAELSLRDPERAARVRARARDFVERILPVFPGDAATGILPQAAQWDGEFPEWTQDDPCPALDPDTGACDLYAARPITCRTFGPAVSYDGGPVGICELCYVGASDAEIAGCEVSVDPEGREDAILQELQEQTGKSGETLVAFALLD